MPLNPFSSLGKSIQAYMPYYAPPVAPQTNFVQGAGQHLADIRQWEQYDQHTRPPTRAPRRIGERWIYSVGPQMFKRFRMIATGAVESSAFQPVLKYTWGETGFNDAIYQAGYPRNLGLSEKVPTIKKEALGVDRSRMLPAPQFKRSVFVNRRAYNSGVPGVPAIPTNGQYS